MVYTFNISSRKIRTTNLFGLCTIWTLKGVSRTPIFLYQKSSSIFLSLLL